MIPTTENIRGICSGPLKYLGTIREIPSDDRKEYLRMESILSSSKSKNLAPENSEVIAGIRSFDNDKGVLELHECALLHPLEKKNGAKTGPMTGVIVHCYDPKSGLYLFQARRKKNIGIRSGSGLIQTAASGFGAYLTPSRVLALKELKEETGVKGRLVLEKDRYLDLNLFMLRIGTEEYPQLIISHIVESDLRGFPVAKDISTIKRIIKSSKSINNEVQACFTVPMDRLSSIVKEIGRSIGYYGPASSSIKNFLRWHGSSGAKPKRQDDKS